MFFDLGAGKLNSALPVDKQSENFKSLGFAFSYNNPNEFSSKVSIAAPIGHPASENGKNPQYWIDLNFFF